jgi:hypothetical protein
MSSRANKMPRRQLGCSKRLCFLRCFILHLLISGAFAPPVFPPVAMQAPPPVSAIGWKTTAATLLLVALVALVVIMMLPRRAAKTREERHEDRAAAQSEVEQAWASFDPKSMTSMSLRPYEKAFAEVQRCNVSTFTELVTIEEKFSLQKHTLTKFLEWKKKVPASLPSDASKTKAEMMAAKRARDGHEAAAKEKRMAEESSIRKADAAEAIAKRYKDSLDDMMLEACDDAILQVSTEYSLEDACKRVCVGARHSYLFNIFIPHRFLIQPSTTMATNIITPLAIAL